MAFCLVYRGLLKSGMGSLAEWREVFRRVAKPPYRFWYRAPAPLMAACGWFPEGRLFPSSSRAGPLGSIMRGAIGTRQVNGPELEVVVAWHAILDRLHAPDVRNSTAHHLHERLSFRNRLRTLLRGEECSAFGRARSHLAMSSAVSWDEPVVGRHEDGARPFARSASSAACAATNALTRSRCRALSFSPWGS